MKDLRVKRLKDCGAQDAWLEELLAYTDNPAAGIEPISTEFPLEDEDHIARWELYARGAKAEGAFAALRKRFAQLQFPIRRGMSQDDAYRRATRWGEFPERLDSVLELSQESALELALHPTMGGRIPVLVAGNRIDFERLVQAFTERNEPEPVPDSMGACIVKGLNNWERIALYREAWERQHPAPTEQEWSLEFKTLVPRKHLYQDGFIILSSGAYSAVSAESIGMEAARWHADSVRIRREHEFFHYFTFRALGQMRNNLLDEVLADFFGLISVYGEFSMPLALRFLGLESFPEYRSGGRLENYQQPSISKDALGVLQCLCYRAIEQLSLLAEQLPKGAMDLEKRSRLALALASKRLDELADAGIVEAVLAESSKQ